MKHLGILMKGLTLGIGAIMSEYEPHYVIGKVYDPEFSVESVEDYQTLIGYLFRTATEYLDDNPEVDPHLLWVTYIAENWQ